MINTLEQRLKGLGFDLEQVEDEEAGEQEDDAPEDMEDETVEEEESASPIDLALAEEAQQAVTGEDTEETPEAPEDSIASKPGEEDELPEDWQIAEVEQPQRAGQDVLEDQDLNSLPD